MENPFAEQLKNLKITSHRKLSFDEQCAFYAGLKLSVPHLAVSIAANVSQLTVSHLARAGSFLGGQMRYPAVAREYGTLGHEAFVHRYLTPVMRDRLAVAIDAVKRRERNPALNSKGYNPLANRYCGRHEWPETSLGLHSVFAIELCPDRCGYLWRNLKPFQGLPTVAWDDAPSNPACQLMGDPSRGPEEGPNAKGFATSKDCFQHIRRRFNPTKAQQLAEASA